ncbi:hypothetical protein EJ04DRAFT_576050 [Polyplosphaeria fusca]|uniref:Heterokaryon incompatibility domain-containing protein n=1 Tax=Polyplosphaeria fusca TaxID=682080 RepID=A0A9P4R2D4_9PLEO|nr:hypothetical protein EJ04DRAFT_576050 [Polyplosphaeria fusca]
MHRPGQCRREESPSEFDEGHLLTQPANCAAASRDHRPAWRSRKSTPIPSLYDPAWRAFSELLQRPWFHRAWIVQEASVTRDLLLLCGKHFIAWNDLVHAVQYAVDMGVFVAHGGSTSFQALKLFETRTDFQAHRLPSLHNVLLRSRSFRATDPRDKVFGLLSLADPTSVESMGLQPDYFLTTEQLYKKVSHALLGRADLDAFHASKVSADNDLPSWVADWSCSDPSIPLTSSQNPQFVEKSLVAANETFFCAAGTSISSPIFDQGGRLLGLKGILIDQIDEVGLLSRTRHLRHVSQLFLLFVQGRDILEQLKDWERVAQVSSRDPYPTGEGHMDAYWKTLCVGRVPQNASSARQDPRFKYYRMIRSLLSFMRIVVRWFPRPRKEVWYNRMYIIMFQTIWKGLGLTPAKIQRIGFPPESQLSNHRRMVKTKKGYTALAPRFAKTGDYVGLFKGGKMPLVVRKEGAEWILIGESYVHGVMKGERWNESGCTLMWFK